MHVRVRCFGKPDTMILVKSKLTKIDQFKRIIKDKFNVQPKLQRLLYGGKLLENEYTFHDYNIKHNDVIQLMISVNAEKVNSNDKEDADNVKENNVLGTKNVEEKEQKLGKLDYKDAESRLYAVGDLVDMQDSELGSWHEGKIIGIYLDPARKISVIENEKSSEITTNTTPTKNRGIASYFCKSPVVQVNKRNGRITEDDLLFKVKMADEDKDDVFCKHKCIRPRARITVAIEDVKPGQTVMVNHNLDDPPEKGHWYDFKVEKVNKVRTGHELYGTIYLGAEGVPRDDTTIKVHDKIYVIEEVIPLSQRTEEYNKLMTTPTEIRPMPLNCLTCRDDEEAECQDCGCYLCLGKESPDKIILCDECNHGYHMSCLRPALQQLPEEDWYCPSCKRDPLAVVAPGASKQARRAHTQPGGRDWGRGMACVGKSKTCPMPANHFGPIPGIEVGMCWRFRIQLSESGVHRPPVSGIHGRDVEGAYSIVLSGGYEDDVDNGHEFIYTGSGGRNLSGNKRTAEQSCDQKLTRENRALARNCAVKGIAEEGGDAGDAWREGRPVRVVRSYKMMKHFPKYAPEEGIRYDGIYKVVKYYPEKGLSGYRVWKYLLRRDDPSPAPWEEGAKKFPIVYPDGYLEAEAEKKALKEKESKKGSKKRNKSPDSDTEPSKKRKLDKTPSGKKSKNSASPKKVASIFDMKSPKSAKKEGPVLSAEELAVMKADTLNAKLWDECIKICEEKDKKEFVEHVTQVFICIICQDVAVNPVTTPCLHNFCMACIKLAFKSCKSESCPACRQSLSGFASETNVPLRTALRTILTGYDAGK